MNLKAIFGNVSQQVAWSHTLRFAGLFNFPIPLRFTFGIGVSQTENDDILQKRFLLCIIKFILFFA
jgi:hypothetical protein